MLQEQDNYMVKEGDIVLGERNTVFEIKSVSHYVYFRSILMSEKEYGKTLIVKHVKTFLSRGKWVIVKKKEHMRECFGRLFSEN